jgi:hypothetical protein
MPASDDAADSAVEEEGEGEGEGEAEGVAPGWAAEAVESSLCVGKREQCARHAAAAAAASRRISKPLAGAVPVRAGR